MEKVTNQLKKNYHYTQPLNGLEVMVQSVCDDDRDRQAHNTDQL